MEKKTNKKLYGTVLIKAAQILDALSSGNWKTTKELSAETNLTPSTVSKILETLCYISYVAKDSANKKYHIGSKFLEYSAANRQSEHLVTVSQSTLSELREYLNETIHLSMPENNQVVYINKLEPSNRSIYMTSKIGLTRPLYSSGMGKAILSTFSEEELQNYLKKTPLIPFTEHTITDESRLKKDLIQSRKQGYAIDDEEQEAGGYCIAVTIEKNARVLGAMSVSFPKFRWTDEYQEKVIQELQKAKRKIEAKLQQ